MPLALPVRKYLSLPIQEALAEPVAHIFNGLSGNGFVWVTRTVGDASRSAGVPPESVCLDQIAGTPALLLTCPALLRKAIFSIPELRERSQFLGFVFDSFVPR